MSHLKHWSKHPFKTIIELNHIPLLYIKPLLELVTVIKLHNGFIRFCYCLQNDYRIFPIHLLKELNSTCLPDFNVLFYIILQFLKNVDTFNIMDRFYISIYYVLLIHGESDLSIAIHNDFQFINIKPFLGNSNIFILNHPDLILFDQALIQDLIKLSESFNRLEDHQKHAIKSLQVNFYTFTKDV